MALDADGSTSLPLPRPRPAADDAAAGAPRALDGTWYCVDHDAPHRGPCPAAGQRAQRSLADRFVDGLAGWARRPRS